MDFEVLVWDCGPCGASVRRQIVTCHIMGTGLPNSSCMTTNTACCETATASISADARTTVALPACCDAPAFMTSGVEGVVVSAILTGGAEALGAATFRTALDRCATPCGRYGICGDSFAEGAKLVCSI